MLIVDAGVNADLSAQTNLVHAKMANGTQNCLEQPAMTDDDCLAALQKGAVLVQATYDQGCNCIGFGEMGIGNTASASLLMQRLTGLALTECVGRGTGLDDAGVQHKTAVLQQVLDKHSVTADQPLAVLACFGGFEIAMMVGAYLQAAELGMVIMVDGFIASAALLVASRCYPNVLDYCVFSHVSNERGHHALLAQFNADALLKLNMRLGEGSGIAVAYPLMQSAVLFLREMATFAEAGVDQSA